MKKPMTVEFRPYYPNEKQARMLTVEFCEVEHWAAEIGLDERVPNPKAYDVVVDGKIIGRIERAILSTDRIYGRIRSPGKGRPGWSATRKSLAYTTSYHRTFDYALGFVLGGGNISKV